MNAAQLMMTKARTALILTQPFFGSLALRLQMTEDSSIDTLAVDGKTLFYNPTYVQTLTFDELKGVVAHEVMHVALKHHTRRGGRDPEAWNDAGDYVINGIVMRSGFKLPKGCLLNPAFDNMSTDEVYNKLPKKPQGGNGQQPQGGGNGNGGQDKGGQQPHRPGAVKDATDKHGKPLSPAEQAQEEAEWQSNVAQARQIAKAQGKLPAELDRLVNELLANKADWRELLRRFMQATARDDYSWTRPNRRYITQGIYLPSVRSERIGPMVVVVDTSGSIGAEELAQFAGEIGAIGSDVKPESINVVYCDAAVAGMDVFMPGDDIALNPRGGGGTDFRPAFEWVEQQGIEPACLIYLTDMCGTFPESEPHYPVMWASTTDLDNAPFGEVIRIN